MNPFRDEEYRLAVDLSMRKIMQTMLQGGAAADTKISGKELEVINLLPKEDVSQ